MIEPGLSAAEAQARLAADGLNELPRAGTRSALKIIGEVLREPMLALLLAGGLVYLLLGNRVEALILLGFASFSIIVTVIQETRTEHVLEALRDLSAPRALVIRDGERVRIAGREVVAGDVLLLDAGDRVAADALLIDAQALHMDESLLTGESVPVRKAVGAEVPDHRPGGDGQPYVYAGSLVTSGTGVARAVATGPRSEIGKIGQSLATLDPEAPRLRAETTRIVKLCAFGGGAIALLVVALYGLTRGDWLQAVLAGIATGMAMLPEEFPVVLTIFMAMGAWRIGRARVLTRRAAAIETLGAATVLCTDKTGTLTENRMVVVAVWLADGEAADLSPDAPAPKTMQALLETATRASAPVPTDPMEIAIHAAHPLAAGTRAPVHSYGLSADLLAMSNIREAPKHGQFLIAAKGAPEAISKLCRLEPEAAAAMAAAVDAMAARGIRVLGVAIAETQSSDWAVSQADYRYTLIGLVGLADPIRASVPAAVADCRSAGIRVVMITGDYAATARAIASQAGIDAGEVLTGPELDALDETALAALLPSITVFARIMPEQKLRIVEAYKAAGDVVAMTGDGVNDAPSLKAAHIGIAMGKRGTDVAREASAIVLLDDDFGAIVHAIRLGWSVVQGGLAFVMLAGAYLTATSLAMPQADVRELVFLSLIMSIVALILANRSFDTSLRHAFTRRNIMLRAVLGVVTLVLVLTLLVPSFRTLLQFGTPDWPSAGISLGLGGLLLVLLETLKALAKHRRGQAKARAT